MNIALTNLAILICTTFTLCLAMTLSWLYFGRRRYTLLWAISAGGGVVQWSLTAMAKASGVDMPWVAFLTGVLVVIDATLIAIGSRDRTGLPLRLALFMAFAIVAVSGIFIMVMIHNNLALRGFITNTYCAMMMIIAGGAVFPRNRVVSVPEILIFCVLQIFALLSLALAMLSLGVGPGGMGAGGDAFRAVLVVGLPSIYAALGIAIVFLLATDLNEQLKALISRDPLTGVLNRRGFGQAASAALASARRRQRPLTLVIGDIDGFRAFNARRGHPIGDRALTGFADLISTNVREEDLIGRIDGDVFGLILIDSDADAACDVVNRVQRDLAMLRIDDQGNLGLTASFGIASGTTEDIDIAAIGRRADEALQRARASGKDRAVAA